MIPWFFMAFLVLFLKYINSVMTELSYVTFPFQDNHSDGLPWCQIFQSVLKYAPLRSMYHYLIPKVLINQACFSSLISSVP